MLVEVTELPSGAVELTVWLTDWSVTTPPWVVTLLVVVVVTGVSAQAAREAAATARRAATGMKVLRIGVVLLGCNEAAGACNSYKDTPEEIT